jgi:hypothetical protein
MGQGTGYADPLALAAGELVGELRRVLGQAEPVDQLPGPCRAILVADEGELELDVLGRSEEGQQVVGLEDEADRMPPELGPPGIGERRDLALSDPDPSGRRWLQSPDEAEEGRLATAARADDGDPAPGLDGEVDAVDGPDQVGFESVLLVDTFEPERDAGSGSNGRARAGATKPSISRTRWAARAATSGL